MGSAVDDAFRGVALFRALSPDERARLGAVSVVRSYGKGEALFAEGDASDFLYTILERHPTLVKGFIRTRRAAGVLRFGHRDVPTYNLLRTWHLQLAIFSRPVRFGSRTPRWRGDPLRTARRT